MLSPPWTTVYDRKRMRKELCLVRAPPWGGWTFS